MRVQVMLAGYVSGEERKMGGPYVNRRAIRICDESKWKVRGVHVDGYSGVDSTPSVRRDVGAWPARLYSGRKRWIRKSGRRRC